MTSPYHALVVELDGFRKYPINFDPVDIFMMHIVAAIAAGLVLLFPCASVSDQYLIFFQFFVGVSLPSNVVLCHSSIFW